MLTYKKALVHQVDTKDCGVAALASIAKFYGSKYSLNHLRELAKTNRDGTTALGIVTAAQTIHFDTRAVKADMSLFKLDDIPYPFIVHVNKEQKFQHYYVVYENRKESLIIGDPDPNVGVIHMAKKHFESEWTGVAIFMTPKPNYKPYKEKSDGLLAFLPFIFNKKGIICQITLASLLITAINILGSYYLQVILDKYIPNNMKNVLDIISICLIITYTIQQLMFFFRDYLLVTLSQRLVIDIILNYIHHIFNLPMSFFSTRKVGEITSRFTDANKIIDALASTILSFLLDFSILITVGIFLLLQNNQLFLLSLTSIPIYAFIIFIFMKPFEQMNNDVMQSNATLSSAIIEDISGIETIKSLSCENHCFQKINKEFFDYLNKSFKLSKYSILQTVLKQSTQLFLNVIMLWLGAQLVIDNKITIGQLIAFNALFSYFIHPLENIINLQTKLQSARVATTRLNEVYLVKSEFQDSPMITNPETLQGKITLKDVHYKYGFGKDTLSNINLQILPGEKIAFVGASGSGKTTLAKIIVNFFEPNKGYIHINGNNLKYIDKRILRQYINYLPQQAYIFSGSILENLTLGASQSTTQADIINACKIANIHSDIESMPRGYETELSDGSGLSGGQKQRIALARGLLSKAPILILDEATSGLDTLTEKKVVDNLLAMTDKTIIFVAHRLSIAERVDQVIVLDNGQIIEQGSHKELFKPNKF